MAVDIASTEAQRITELNSKVSTAYPSLAAGSDPQAANDRALGRLAANSEILGLRGTRTNP
jgi:hypothetical protein